MLHQSKNRIFYCGMINTDSYKDQCGFTIFIGAGSNKMLGVLHSLHAVGAKAFLISMPILGRDAKKKYIRSISLNDGNIPQIFLSTYSNPYLRIINNIFQFAFFCIKEVKNGDKVILYNHSFEYILGLIILFVKNNIVFLDIEDAPHSTKGWRGFTDFFFFKIFNKLTDSRKIVTSEQLAKSLSIDNYLVIYGAIKSNKLILGSEDGKRRLAYNPQKPLLIHYGGSLCDETGLSLFCAAAKELINIFPNGKIRVHFIITGFGADERIMALRDLSYGSGVDLTFLPNLPYDEYIKVFKNCHIAMSLRLPDSKLSINTFPSKVLEILSNGLLLITTRSSDIPILFSQDEVVFINQAVPMDLVKSIIWCIHNHLEVEKIAHRGHIKALSLFNEYFVGKSILKFLEN